MGHVGDRLELERAFSGATVHDMPQPKYRIDSRIDSRRSWECSKPSAADRCAFVTTSLAVLPYKQYRVSMGRTPIQCVLQHGDDRFNMFSVMVLLPLEALAPYASLESQGLLMKSCLR